MFAGYSDVGRRRTQNEDRIHLDPTRGVFLVVDGLGGHAAGERAAEVAVEIITSRLARQTGTPEQRIREAFALATQEIYSLASSDPQLAGMACVATLALFHDDQVIVGHVGDSRLYLLQPGSIRKVTHDHSPVGEREDAGELTELAAMAHPRRNEVFRDLGSELRPPDDPDFVEIQRFPFQPETAVLLCSDGLTDQVTSEVIRQLVEKHADDPDAAVRELVAAANEAGGKDNVSVILVEGAEYPSLVQRQQDAHSRVGLPPFVWFLLGLLAATALLLLFRPYVEETATGKHLGFGTVRPPITWTVGPGGIPTISEALSRALTGDTISVAPGVYHETLRLRSGVTVVCSAGERAKLQADDNVILAENTHGARLSGCEISGPANVGILIKNSDLEVTGVVVTGMLDSAVEIDGSPAAVVESSEIADNPGTGIYLHGGARASIRHNLITRNGRSTEPRPGLYIAGTADPQVFDNIISGNGAEQVWTSPLFDSNRLLDRNVVLPDDRRRQIKVVTR